MVKEEVKEVDMKKLITQSCNDMSIKANKYSLTIVQNINHGVIRAQEDRIRQVMINLIDNAIKYSVNGKEIYVNSYWDQDKYYVEVINHSNPIPEEIFNNIFEPFVKLNEVNNKESRGLGLYLCNEIVKEHGGEIIIENDELVKVRVTLEGSM
ncbi:Alginate biosynthesis sensor protein KinB [bioreactor metagenome]|uniref:histidine kinase n=1 Tax=bioreactor metagenome TaxID=1076179 RepID=A0A645JEU5_9ZZZZ